jgi:hypothetical protein
MYEESKKGRIDPDVPLLFSEVKRLKKELKDAYELIEMCGDCCTQDASECLERLREENS